MDTAHLVPPTPVLIYCTWSPLTTVLTLAILLQRSLKVVRDRQLKDEAGVELDGYADVGS